MEKINEFKIKTNLDFNLNNLIDNKIEIENIDIETDKRYLILKNTEKLDELIENYNFFYCNLKKFKTIKSSKPGYLNYTNISLNFQIERIFTLDNFNDLNNQNNKRGDHFNKNFDELIIINQGEIEFKVITKTNIHLYFNLNKNDIFYFPRNFWLSFKIINPETIITVLCNKNFENSISCYNFQEFLNS